MNEEWRPVGGYEGFYEVSDHGRVRSLPRAYTGGRVLRSFPDRDGYLLVNLTAPQRGRRKARVHQLVAEVFERERPSPAHEVRHLNGVRWDNRAGNLLWGTTLENQHDRLRHGTTRVGEQHGRAKVTEAQVREIRASTAGTTALARRYGVARGTIGFIRAGTTWRHVAAETGKAGHMQQ